MADKDKKEENEENKNLSDDELNAEPVCNVCLASKFRSGVIGVPDCCNHRFCGHCIIEWAQNSTTCPIDRLEFVNISFIKADSEKILFTGRANPPLVVDPDNLIEDESEPINPGDDNQPAGDEQED